MSVLLQTVTVLLVSSTCLAQQEANPFLELLPAVASVRESPGVSGVCPSTEAQNQLIASAKEEVSSILNDKVIPSLEGQAMCPCGGQGRWHRIAQLDMTDVQQECPPDFRLITSPKRACGRSTSGCNSVVFPSNGVSYSRVCGRVVGYQRGSPNAFSPSFTGGGLEDIYVEGISITHGPPGSRQHIWTFAVAIYDYPPSILGPESICPCSSTERSWTLTLPAFLQNNYFCDSGNRGSSVSITEVYTDDPLWDGAGCPDTSTCCKFNTPPWFCTTLDQATSEDIEFRICTKHGPDTEDVDVEKIDIYVQ